MSELAGRTHMQLFNTGFTYVLATPLGLWLRSGLSVHSTPYRLRASPCSGVFDLNRSNNRQYSSRDLKGFFTMGSTDDWGLLLVSVSTECTSSGWDFPLSGLGKTPWIPVGPEVSFPNFTKFHGKTFNSFRTCIFKSLFHRHCLNQHTQNRNERAVLTQASLKTRGLPSDHAVLRQALPSPCSTCAFIREEVDPCCCIAFSPALTLCFGEGLPHLMVH